MATISDDKLSSGGSPTPTSKSTPKRKRKRRDETVQVLKHYDTFYGQAPPGLVQEEREHPEDCIPNLPENHEAREFLAKAPTKGLWMPLGKEVKVMKCWRCKTYGHRTGDRECPLFVSGNAAIEKFRYSHEDPMHNFINETKKAEKEARIAHLKALLDSSSDSSDSESTSSSSLHSHHSKKHKYKHRKHKKKHKKERLFSDSSDNSTTSSSNDCNHKKCKHKQRRHKRKSKEEKKKKRKKNKKL